MRYGLKTSKKYINNTSKLIIGRKEKNIFFWKKSPSEHKSKKKTRRKKRKIWCKKSFLCGISLKLSTSIFFSLKNIFCFFAWKTSFITGYKQPTFPQKISTWKTKIPLEVNTRNILLSKSEQKKRKYKNFLKKNLSHRFLATKHPILKANNGYKNFV